MLPQVLVTLWLEMLAHLLPARMRMKSQLESTPTYWWSRRTKPNRLSLIFWRGKNKVKIRYLSHASQNGNIPLKKQTNKKHTNKKPHQQKPTSSSTTLQYSFRVFCSPFFSVSILQDNSVQQVCFIALKDLYHTSVVHMPALQSWCFCFHLQCLSGFQLLTLSGTPSDICHL